MRDTSSSSTPFVSGSAAFVTTKDETFPSEPPKLDFYADPLASEEEKLVLYSEAIYEYTRQLWIETRRRAQVEYDLKRQRERERSLDRERRANPKCTAGATRAHM